MLGAKRQNAHGATPSGLLALVVIAATLGAIGAALLGALHGLSNEAHDALINTRNGDRGAPTSVVVFEVDANTLRSQKTNKLPLDRQVYADAIDRLADLKPRAIAIDIQFTEQSDKPESDEALFYAIVDAKVPVILGTSEVLDNGDTAVLGGKANLDEIGAVAAHSALPHEEDRYVRRLDPSHDGLVTFAQATAEAVGRPGLPRNGTLVDPTVPGDNLRRASLRRLLDPAPIDPALVRGRIAVIGSTIVGGEGDDDQLLAGSADALQGVQVQAQAIDTALRGEPLRDATRFLPYVLALLVGFGAALGARRALWVQLGIAAVSLTGLVGLSIVLVKSGWLTDPVPALVALIVASLGAMAVRAEGERRRRAAARATLGRFVPPGVVDELLEGDRDGHIAPRGQQASVLFCDLRGYTALVASLRDPQALITILDTYLSAVTETVQRHGGTVVSFQGDGVMSAFGTPVPTDESPAQAIAVARELQEQALPRIREELAAVVEGAEELRLGVGVATGGVFAGTVGPPERREYAVVGPTTNLAARLQALTKTEGVDVVLDAATAAAVRALIRSDGGTSGAAGGDGPRAHTGIALGSHHGLRLLGPRGIRGLDAPIEVWTLAPVDEAPPARADA